MKKIEDYLKVDSTSKTGLRWIKKPCKKVRVGDEAFTRIDSWGYYGGKFNYKSYSAHRVIIYLVHGKWSSRKLHTDHIDANKLNNRIENLILRPPISNQRNSNRRLNSNNKTGIKGLERIKQHGYIYWRSKHAGDILYTGNNKQIALERLEKARKDDPYYID